MGRYIARAGWEEAQILRARRPIPELVADPATPAPVREKLRLVLDARVFAADLSRAVEANRDNCARVPGHFVCQADRAKLRVLYM